MNVFLFKGRMLLNKAVDHLEIKQGIRNSGLSGREAVISTYVKYGFTNCVWDVVGYGGKADPVEVSNFDRIAGVDVIRITNDNLDLLLTYDKTIQTVSNRKHYFQQYLADDSNVICVAVRDDQGNGKVFQI